MLRVVGAVGRAIDRVFVDGLGVRVIRALFGDVVLRVGVRTLGVILLVVPDEVDGLFVLRLGVDRLEVVGWRPVIPLLVLGSPVVLRALGVAWRTLEGVRWTSGQLLEERAVGVARVLLLGAADRTEERVGQAVAGVLLREEMALRALSRSGVGAALLPRTVGAVLVRPPADAVERVPAVALRALERCRSDSVVGKATAPWPARVLGVTRPVAEASRPVVGAVALGAVAAWAWPGAWVTAPVSALGAVG